MNEWIIQPEGHGEEQAEVPSIIKSQLKTSYKHSTSGLFCQTLVLYE